MRQTQVLGPGAASRGRLLSQLVDAIVSQAEKSSDHRSPEHLEWTSGQGFWPNRHVEIAQRYFQGQSDAMRLGIGRNVIAVA